jgi:uncharacterized membrane protein YedE/YeeE
VDAIDSATLIGSAGLAIGLVFGAVTRQTGFCTMGALSDVVYLDDWRRLRSWMLAVAVAIAGGQGLHAAGVVNLDRSVWLAGPASWGGTVLGGLMFGTGMTLAGGCGAKTLVRLGGGNLKSLVVVLVGGLFAMMTLKGLLAPFRLLLEDVTALGAAPALPVLLREAGLPPLLARGLPTAAIGGGLLWWCLKDRDFRSSAPDVVGGLGVGVLIAAGWAATGLLGGDPFAPVAPTSLTFAAPIGGALIYLMTCTGATLTFGIATAAGTVAGAFAVALSTGRLRLEGFANIHDMLRHLAGAALMGSGGVLALGCTVGQGLTGVSTLSVLSVLATAAIVAGGVLNLKRLEEGSLAGALRALLNGALRALLNGALRALLKFPEPATDSVTRPPPGGNGCSG